MRNRGRQYVRGGIGDDPGALRPSYVLIMAQLPVLLWREPTNELSFSVPILSPSLSRGLAPASVLPGKIIQLRLHATQGDQLPRFLGARPYFHFNVPKMCFIFRVVRVPKVRAGFEDKNCRSFNSRKIHLKI